MGTQDGKKLEQRDARRASSDRKRAGGKSPRLEQMRGSGKQTVADWASVNPAIMMALISVVTAADAMVSFSYSRDGGAYCVSIYDDGDKERFWIPCSGDVEEEIRQILAFWQ